MPGARCMRSQPVLRPSSPQAPRPWPPAGKKLLSVPIKIPRDMRVSVAEELEENQCEPCSQNRVGGVTAAGVSITRDSRVPLIPQFVLQRERYPRCEPNKSFGLTRNSTFFLFRKMSPTFLGFITLGCRSSGRRLIASEGEASCTHHAGRSRPQLAGARAGRCPRSP